MRDVQIAGNTFEIMPVYEHCEKRVEPINEAYNNTLVEGEQAGMDAFVESAMFLTKKGESKADFLTYYINLRYRASIFTQKMTWVLGALPMQIPMSSELSR